MNVQIDLNYITRPVQIDDVESATDLFNAFSRSQVGLDQFTVDSTRSEWRSPAFNLETDTMAVFTPDHRPIGYMEFWDVAEPHVRLFGWGAVHPEFWNYGIGSFLVSWLVDRARRNLDKAPAGARVVLQSYADDKNRDARALFTRFGFEHIRNSYNMRIDFNEPPQAPVTPDGITIRSIKNDAEKRSAMYAAYESFKDHFGNVPEPFEAYYERHKYHIDTDPHHDPSVWFIALDNEEIAGVSLCSLGRDEDPDLGWVGTLGVRRPWRKRGVGQALLQHSFCELYQRGKPRVGLGVDASSLTGATRLYERAGMYVYRKHNLYEIELRPGEDLMTRSV